MSVWQSEEQRCGVVLREVFAWLGGRDLARAGAACRAWRRAAATPALWRCLLAAPTAAWVSWRQEYVRAHAGWRLTARHRAGAPLLHAALDPSGALLALAAADASLLVWVVRAGAWVESGHADMRARGWAAVARSQWATAGRLLLAGPLALVPDWELLVLHVEDDGRCGAVYSRVRCSAGAAGCWADPAGEAFLSFELRRLGAGLYCTTVWLNAATQETESEYAGVTSPLLRIFNEEGAHLTHALVVQTPELMLASEPTSPAGDDAYLRAVQPGEPDGWAARLLVAGAGCRLSAWVVRSPRPPPLQASAGGGLAERVRRQRERRAAAEPDEAEPDEEAVRAGCEPPARLARLHAPLVGLALQERGRCMWAVSSDGSATCVSVPEMQVLARVPGQSGAGDVHYVQPAAAAGLVAWPVGGRAGRVQWVAAVARAGGVLAHGAAAVCCVLPRAGLLLVLAGDELYEWGSRATPQLDARCC